MRWCDRVLVLNLYLSFGLGTELTCHFGAQGLQSRENPSIQSHQSVRASSTLKR